MNANLKHLSRLIFLASLVCLLAGLTACGLVKQGPTSDAATVSKTASRIADFTLPEGYREEYALDLASVTVAAYNPGDNHSHLYFIQGPKDMSLDEDALRKAAGTYDATTRLTVVETRTATVRGQEVNVLISEGTNSDGQDYRELSVAFHGKGGPALMVIEEPTSRWTQEKIDAFVASIQ